ncbi:MAG TPA: hypothetical protein VFW71_02610 [Actinomycetota bacterium]|nr:hypothetical protein [Actinomycetota bacterium]
MDSESGERGHMHPYLVGRLVAERQGDLAREAAAARLGREAAPRPVGRVREAAGASLIALGRRLAGHAPAV